MSGIATAVLVGNLTGDPETIANGNGCTFGLAVNQRIKKADEWQDHASFFNIVVWGKAAEACVKYLGKGSKAAVDAEVRQERWESDGNKRSTVKFIARSVQFLGDSKGGGGSREPDVPADQRDFQSAASSTDDDIPF